MSHRDRNLRERAASLLRSNDRGKHTIPSPHLYPHQWAWDSAFAAIGWLHVDPARGLTELQSILDGQWDDGRIPHIQFHTMSDEYFPGPDVWGHEKSSSISNPPIWTMAARKFYDAGVDHEQIREMLDALERSHLFFHEQRDPLGWGIVCTAHPWENGLDNCPAWDEPMASVDVSGAPELRRVDKDRVADPDQRPTDAQYVRYLALVRGIADDDFGMADFAVYDPFLTTMLILAERDLAYLARAFDLKSDALERAQSLQDALMERLWSDALVRCVFHDAISDRTVAPDVLPAYAPLLVLDASDPRAAAMKERLERTYWTSWPLPSTSPDDPAFDGRRYWRGPTWINMNWLFSPVFGSRLVEQTLELVEQSGFWEYFDPETGEGLGTDDFTWSAALTLDLLS